MTVEIDNQRLKDLLDQVLDLEPRDREAFLARECSDAPELRAEIESLLGEEDALDEGFLDVPAAVAMADGPTLDWSGNFPMVAGPPSELGHYRILATLGRGGMGTVFLGEQYEPVRRRAAVKIIDAIHDRSRMRRFAAECRALARLHHPNVASLYEVGSTDDGHPFVAMELVEGQAITVWCDEHELGLRERIELFLGVCAGVQHAHEKGLLHRDLKPSNVLVTEIDSLATAKVIDFGIAFAIDDEPLHNDTRLTLDHQLIGSPAYMSPEALQLGSDLDLDTRSDVYSLGLLLFELLAGVLPFDTDEPTLSTLLQRLSSEEELTNPSRRVGELEPERRQELAASRGVNVETHQRRLRGDLDAIIHKAVARDRQARYGSPRELAADLERHLASEPIEARAPSTAYVFSRFVRRRLGVVVSLTALILTLVASILVLNSGFVGQKREAERANREAQRAKEALVEAEEVSSFLVSLFELADPERHRDDPVDLYQLLGMASERLATELSGQPLVRARMHHTLGEIYSKMGEYEQSARHLLQAVEIRTERLDSTDPDLLTTLNWLGSVYRRQGRLSEAERVLRQVLEGRQNVENPDFPQVAIAYNNLGNLFWSKGQFEDAAAAHQRALALRESALGPDHADIGETLNNLGVMKMELGEWEEANSSFERAGEIFRREMGEAHPRVGATVFNRAEIERKRGRWQQALVLNLEAASLWEEAYGVDHPRPLMARRRVARIHQYMGDFEQSIQLAMEIVSLASNRSEPIQDEIALSSITVGQCLARLGDFSGAEVALRRALEARLASPGDQTSAILTARFELARLARQSGRFESSFRAHREVLEQRMASFGEDHRSLADSWAELGLVKIELGLLAEGIELLERAKSRYEQGESYEAYRLGNVERALGVVFQRQEELTRARAALERAAELHSVLPPANADRLETKRELDVLRSLERRSAVALSGQEAAN